MAAVAAHEIFNAQSEIKQKKKIYYKSIIEDMLMGNTMKPWSNMKHNDLDYKSNAL